MKVVKNMQSQVLELDTLPCKNSVYVSPKSDVHY